MELKLAVVADYAYVGDGSKLYILGEFRNINVPQVPAIKPRFFVALRLFAEKVEVRDGSAMVRFEITDEDGTPIMERSPEMKLRFGKLGPSAPAKMFAQAILEIEGMPLPHTGSYSVHVWHGDHHLGEAVFTVQLQPKRPG